MDEPLDALEPLSPELDVAPVPSDPVDADPAPDDELVEALEPVEDWLPEVEAAAAPGSSCATKPVMTTADAADRPATQRARCLGRERPRSRRDVSCGSDEPPRGSSTMSAILPGLAEPTMNARFEVAVDRPTP